MRISIGCDHAGYLYKEKIKAFLVSLGHEVVDYGTHSETPVDYPDFVFPVSRAVSSGYAERGVVIGGSGNGEAMVANKVSGIRCAVSWNQKTARLSREHNDANMLAIGQRVITLKTALQIITIWMKAEFEGGRHSPRVQKMHALDQEGAGPVDLEN